MTSLRNAGRVVLTETSGSMISGLDNPIVGRAISESDAIHECSHQGLPRLQHLQSQACLNGRR